MHLNIFLLVDKVCAKNSTICIYKERSVLNNLYTFQIQRDQAQVYGVHEVYDRILTELTSKMREMDVDKEELGCLRSIVLYNAGKTSIKTIGS